MKNLKLILLTIALVGGLLTVNAQQTVVKVYPKHGTVVQSVTKSRVIVHNNAKYYLANGVWYMARGRKYVVVGAPVGVKVRRLPRGNKVVVVNGRRLYSYNGVYYKKLGRNYVVVNV